MYNTNKLNQTKKKLRG